MDVFHFKPDSPIHILMQSYEKGEPEKTRKDYITCEECALSHRHIPEPMRSQQHADFRKHKHVDASSNHETDEE